MICKRLYLPLLPQGEMKCVWCEMWPGLQIRALKFQSLSSKFPRARTFELFRARSRLYRSQILQVNTRWKALAEIYTMHSFAPFSNLKIFVKNCWNFCWFFDKNLISQILPEFCWILLNFDKFEFEISRNFVGLNSIASNQNYQIFAEKFNSENLWNFGEIFI